MFRRILYAALGISAVIGAPSPLLAQSRYVYRVDDLGSLGGTYVYGQSINVHGEVAGSAEMPDGKLHAVRWSLEAGLVDLGTNGGVESQASGINDDDGDVVGLYFDADYVAHNFIAPRGGAIRDLSPDIFQASEIGNDGRVTGMSGNSRAFITRSDGTVQDISAYVGFGAWINDVGSVAGWGWNSDDIDTPHTAFRYTGAAGYANLGTLGGEYSGARSINNQDVAVGFSGDAAGHSSRAFRAKPGQPLEDLGSLPGGFAGGLAAASGINDAGEIVGYSDSSTGWAATVYSDAAGLIDLRLRIPLADRATGVPHEAIAINNGGQILAIYSTPTGGIGTMRLTPVLRVPRPVISSIEVDRPVLWPPNGRMVTVSLMPYVADVYDPAPECRITDVVNSDRPQGWFDPDVDIVAPLSVRLRAIGLGNGPGRIYTISVRCTSYLGKSSSADVAVRVPR